MALGSPDIGTGSSWFSQYDPSITALLSRVYDNSSNVIVAKDLRDSIWSLYNRILDVATNSLTQSSLYTLGTPSTISVGGIAEGSTFSDASMSQIFDRILLPYVAPQILSFSSSVIEYQFGRISPSLNLNYNINIGSKSISSINFKGPNLAISSDTGPFNSDPYGGTRSSIVPTYSTTVSSIQYNIFTMSVVTADSLSFSATCSLIYKHKKYYGSIVIPGGFTPSSSSSISYLQSYLTDSIIKGLTYSELTTDFTISKDIIFVTGSYFIFAAPTIFGDLPQGGFYVENMFSNDFTKIRSSSTFSNEYSYQAPYDIWISNSSFGSVTAKIYHY